MKDLKLFYLLSICLLFACGKDDDDTSNTPPLPAPFTPLVEGTLSFVLSGPASETSMHLIEMGQPSADEFIEDFSDSQSSEQKSFDWSLNGKLAYLDSGNLIVKELDGTEKSIPLPDASTDFELSNDGSSLVYVTKDKQEVRSIDIESAQEVVVSRNVDNQGNYYYEQARWSPDQKKIAFLHVNLGSKVKVYDIDSDAIVTTPYFDNDWFVHFFLWNSDSQSIYFSSEGKDKMYHCNISSGARTEPYIGGSSQIDWVPALSPDGKMIAYADSPFRAPVERKIFDLDLGQFLYNCKDFDCSEPDWTSDSNIIVYIDKQAQTILLEDLTDSSKTQILYEAPEGHTICCVDVFD